MEASADRLQQDTAERFNCEIQVEPDGLKSMSISYNDSTSHFADIDENEDIENLCFIVDLSSKRPQFPMPPPSRYQRCGIRQQGAVQCYKVPGKRYCALYRPER